ncbi:MAG: hypothetical protein FRX49_13436 [Trebouxia sp. A1-2]|nr:MAG: hypothetical protein FRX49_13436 [Trebouxia sp. A1-2]
MSLGSRIPENTLHSPSPSHIDGPSWTSIPPSKAEAGSWVAGTAWSGWGERRPDSLVRPVSLSLVGCPRDGLFSAVAGDTTGITSKPYLQQHWHLGSPHTLKFASTSAPSSTGTDTAVISACVTAARIFSGGGGRMNAQPSLKHRLVNSAVGRDRETKDGASMLLAKQQQSVTSSKTAAERVALGRQVHGVFVQLDLTRGVGHRDLPGGVNGRVGVATLHATLDLPWAQCKERVGEGAD